jgi:hypothetical protein
MNSNGNDPLINEESRSILRKAQRIIELEKTLTEKLDQVEPWLQQSRSNRHHTANRHRVRVRRIPESMEEAEWILAVARNLAARTSAPAGWNPQAPVLGFATPNPLPHQLRGGALANLQRERVIQQQRLSKQQRMLLLSQQTQQQQEENVTTTAAVTSEETVEGAGVDVDPKRGEIQQHLQKPRQPATPNPPDGRLPGLPIAQPRRPETVSMNLSDSESSESSVAGDKMEEDD